MPAGAGVLAALLFGLLPVVTCMAHEAKPHLPGAVLMLAACCFAMRALDLQRAREWAGVFVCCGAAVGMVLSSAPISIPSWGSPVNSPGAVVESASLPST